MSNIKEDRIIETATIICIAAVAVVCGCAAIAEAIARWW